MGPQTSGKTDSWYVFDLIDADWLILTRTAGRRNTTRRVVRSDAQNSRENITAMLKCNQNAMSAVQNTVLRATYS